MSVTTRRRSSPLFPGGITLKPDLRTEKGNVIVIVAKRSQHSTNKNINVLKRCWAKQAVFTVILCRFHNVLRCHLQSSKCKGTCMNESVVCPLAPYSITIYGSMYIAWPTHAHAKKHVPGAHAETHIPNARTRTHLPNTHADCAKRANTWARVLANVLQYAVVEHSTAKAYAKQMASKYYPISSRFCFARTDCISICSTVWCSHAGFNICVLLLC